MSDESGLQTVPSPEATLPTIQEQTPSIEAFQKALRATAQDRRRKKTAKSRVKKREGSDGKFFSYVDRPDYQIWLDDTFPGWSHEVPAKFWTDYITAEDGKTVPALFNCHVHIKIVESNGFTRHMTGIGSCTVSAKEYAKGNTFSLAKKYEIALTNAMKCACNWLGAFFDLRADEEERERNSQEPTPAQIARYNALRMEVPVEMVSAVDNVWKTQNATSADQFLNGLEKKLRNLSAPASQTVPTQGEASNVR